MSNNGGALGLPGSLDLNQLRTFLAVYRTGSFTAAARLLGLSQPTVTMQIRALERQLGRPLYERLPTGAAPSAVADELAAEIRGPPGLPGRAGRPLPGRGRGGARRAGAPGRPRRTGLPAGCCRPSRRWPSGACGCGSASALANDLLEGLQADATTW